MGDPDRVVKRWQVWNMNYRATDKDCRRLVRYADVGLPWAVHDSDDYRFFATHAQALEYAHQQTRLDGLGGDYQDHENPADSLARGTEAKHIAGQRRRTA